MACRYPGGVASPEDLWQLVADGARRHRRVPRPTAAGTSTRLYDPDPDQPGTQLHPRRAASCTTPADFDAGVLRDLARARPLAMDPQQRLLLETAWEALERAGIDPAVAARQPHRRLRRASCTTTTPRGCARRPRSSRATCCTGSAGSVASGRVAYTLGLEGPAVTVDTACSSSLVALHLAARRCARASATWRWPAASP